MSPELPLIVDLLVNLLCVFVVRREVDAALEEVDPFDVAEMREGFGSGGFELLKKGVNVAFGQRRLTIVNWGLAIEEKGTGSVRGACPLFRRSAGWHPTP